MSATATCAASSRNTWARRRTRVATTRRVLFAKQLIDQTSLPMAQIAFAAGFASVRRFNDAMREAYQRPPRALRRAASAGRGAETALELRLAYRPPFAWDDLLAFLALRAIPGVECVADGAYRRAFRIDDAVGWLEVQPVANAHQLAVRIHPGGGALRLIDLGTRLRALFDLGAAPDAIAAQLGEDPLLRRPLRSAPGVRVPGALDGFELAVRAILGQQVTVVGATRLAGRLVSEFGRKLPAACQPADGRPAPTHEFPSAEALCEADVARIGMPAARAEAIRALARAVADGQLELGPDADPDATRRALLSLPGVGPWTATYIAMRALREPDAFPAGDLGLRRALGVDEAALVRRAERWRPWRAYAAMLLWQHPPAARARSARPPARSARLPARSR